MEQRKFKVLTIVLAIILTAVMAGCGAVPPEETAPVVGVVDTVDVVDDVSQTKPTITCTDEAEGEPVITSLSVNTGSIKTDFEINGCNFSGFEGDTNAWIENDQGVKGILYGQAGSTSKLIKVSLEASVCQTENSYSGLPCDDWLTLSPGTYEIYVTPWGKESNRMEFTVITTPVLSESHKSIVIDGQTLLEISNDVIFNFFKNESGLCDESNIDSTPERRMFCEDKETFKSMTRFASIVISPNRTEIGFTIESDALTPDKVVGFLDTTGTNNKVSFLTNYYIGNDFISFSPNGKYFVYQGNCWEAMCGLYFKDSATLTEQLSLNNPEYLDERTKDAEFVRWITNNKVEYKLGTELKQASF